MILRMFTARLQLWRKFAIYYGETPDNKASVTQKEGTMKIRFVSMLLLATLVCATCSAPALATVDGTVTGPSAAYFGAYGVDCARSLQIRDVVWIFRGGRYLGDAMVVAANSQRALIVPKGNDVAAGDLVMFARHASAPVFQPGQTTVPPPAAPAATPIPATYVVVPAAPASYPNPPAYPNPSTYSASTNSAPFYNSSYPPYGTSIAPTTPYGYPAYGYSYPMYGSYPTYGYSSYGSYGYPYSYGYAYPYVYGPGTVINGQTTMPPTPTNVQIPQPVMPSQAGPIIPSNNHVIPSFTH